MNYGEAPRVIGQFAIPDTEMVFVLYMPVRLKYGPIVVPPHLEGYKCLVEAALNAEGINGGGKYVYLTVKRLYVEPGCIGGRPGWHTDGFGTDDVNYIWTDRDPTEFCVQPFRLSDDHEISMKQMEEQALAKNIVTYDPIDLIRIDARHVHRCPENPSPGVRTFARVSISDHKYNLQGNAHNHCLDYVWIMHPRGAIRNDTSVQSHAHSH